MPVVRMPDGQLVDMPDDPDPKLLAEVQLRSAPKTSKRPVTGDEFLRQLGLTARIPAHIATGTAGVLTDAATGIYNTAADKLGAGGPRFKQITPALNEIMDKFLPKPETPLEHAVQFGGELIGGGADPVMRAGQAALAAKDVPKGFAQAQLNAQQETFKELHDAGYKFLPSQMKAGKGALITEGISNPQRIAQSMELSNQEVTKNLTKKALGLPQTADITEATLKQHADDLLETGYNPIRNTGMMRADTQYKKDLAKIRETYQSKSFPDDVNANITDRLRNLYQSSFDSNDVVNKMSQLRREAKDQFKHGDSNYGYALRDMSKALEDATQRSLERRGKDGAEILSSFKDARKGLAQNYAVEQMMVDKFSGIIDPKKAAALYDRGTPLTDELVTVAKAGGKMYNKTTGAPTGGAPSPMSFMEGVFGGAGLATAPFTGGLGLGAAALPAARAGGRMALQTDTMQNRMMNHLAKQGKTLFGAPAEELDLIRAGITPSVSSLFEQ